MRMTLTARDGFGEALSSVASGGVHESFGAPTSKGYIHAGFLRHRPSGAMLVAVMALILAASGTAIAASAMVKGDKLIKKRSLSGNRLRNHTITGKQVNLKNSARCRMRSRRTAPRMRRTPRPLTARRRRPWHQCDQRDSTRERHECDSGRLLRGHRRHQDVVKHGLAGPHRPPAHDRSVTISGACTTVTGQPDAQTQVATSQANSALDSFASGSKTPFGPSDGHSRSTRGGRRRSATPVGRSQRLRRGALGDGHTYANTFASAGTGLNGHDCTSSAPRSPSAADPRGGGRVPFSGEERVCARRSGAGESS